MSHKPPINLGETVDAYLRRVQREHAAGADNDKSEDGDVKLPLSIQPIGGGIGMLVDADGVPVVGDDGMPILRNVDASTGSGTGGSFASSQAGAELAFQQEQTLLGQNHENELAILQQQLQNSTGLQAQSIQAQIDLENLRHTNDLKELGLQFENQLKTSLIGEIGAERRTLIGEQGALKRQLLELGPDPFLQSFNLSGQVARGITPQQAAVGQAQQFIDQPLQPLDFNATLPQLQAQLGTVQGIQAPTLGGGFGLPSPSQVAGLPSLAHGGVIEMEKGLGGSFAQKAGAFSVKPSTGKQAFLVGDGAGVIPGITEVLAIGDGKMEVIPLTGGGQGGLTFSTTQQALQPLFQGLGFSQIPTARSKFGPGQVITSPLSRLGTLSTLGIRPNLVRDAQTGTYYLISPEGIQHIGPTSALRAAGLNPDDAVNLLRSEYLQLGPALPGVFTGSLPPPPTGTPPAFQALGRPLIEASTGAILPAPFKQARLLGQFARERPDLFNLALSAFKNVLDPVTGLPTAGLSPSSVIAQIEAATPTGRFERPQRVGFTGRRL